MKINFHRVITACVICSMGIIILNLPGQNFLQTLKVKSSNQITSHISPNISSDPIPRRISQAVEPDILSAQAVFAQDVKSAVILFEKNSQQKLMPASTTKIMTALVALDQFQLDEIITIKDENLSIGNTSDLVAGEQITVLDALKALLIGSGNDAALALGQHDPEGYGHFVAMMNQKAEELQMTDSHFSNVSGVEQPDHYVTARDLAILTKEAMKNELFREIVATDTTTITSVDGNISHRLENTNELLGEIDGVMGVKTGWTLLAGECLVTYVERENHQIITVLLNSQDRFGESAKLIDWIYQNYQWQPFPIDVTQPLPVPILDQLLGPSL